MKKILFLLSMFFVLSPVFVSAQSPFKGGEGSGFTKFFKGAIEEQSDLTNTAQANLAVTLPIAVGRIINLLLGFVGVILLLIYVWAGFLWLTAGGANDQVDKAKKYIKNATIGMILALSVFTLTSLVVNYLEGAVQQATKSGGTQTTQQQQP